MEIQSNSIFVIFWKAFTEFVTIFLQLYVLDFWPQGLWNVSSPTRDSTCTPWNGRQSLNHWLTREAPNLTFKIMRNLLEANLKNNQRMDLCLDINISQFSSVQSLSRVWLFATPWIAARQASLSITNSQRLLKPMSIELVMPSNHLILCRPLLLLPPTPPSIGVFSNESTLCMRWPKYWSFSFSISPSNEHPGLISHVMF